ncbi:hypothetical protein C8R45DRAFT_250254 [Mycena sanguinolenta]|nr:hypothetical protein C8R45DRAFT_250254 [Mycena sanguinolenta]
MDEEYYDWELEESASEGEGDGSGEGSVEDESFEQQQSFVLEPSHLGPTSPRSPRGEGDSGATSENDDADADADADPDAEMEMDLAANGMGGVLSSFYIAPQQQAHFPPQLQMPMHLPPPLPLPPPALGSVRVPALRHFFTDIPITPAGGEGAVRGRGTPVDSSRKAAWGGSKAGGDDGEVEMGADLGRGTLERRQPHPRPRPHPMYLAMARAAEAERAQYGGGEGGPVEGVADQDLPPMPRLREPGEPPMLPMRGLKEMVRSMRGPGVEEEGTPEERLEREQREMSEAFEPDEAVWQEFLKSVGVEGAAVAATGEDGRAAMDVDVGQQNSIDADADADSDPDYDIEESGGAGGTSGGVALGLSPASVSGTPAGSSSSGSMLSAGVGMGVEMGIGMFGMAIGAMGMGGWFTGPTSPPVPVAVGDGGGERERESSLSFALGV